MRNTGLTGSRLRPGKTEDETKKEEKEEAKEDKADIKSNNPHLTCGEKNMLYNPSLPVIPPEVWCLDGMFLVSKYLLARCSDA